MSDGSTPVEPVTVPARILVKGCSTAVWVAPPNGPRSDLVFARWLERLLPSYGLPVQVWNAGVHGQLVTKALCDWAEEVQAWSPDVVILNFGVIESMARLVPLWLHRHIHSWHHHYGRLRGIYRHRVLRSIWPMLRGYQRSVDLLLKPGPGRVSPKRMQGELVRYIEQVRQIASPLVIVMDVWNASAGWKYWMPGFDTRAERLRAAIAAAVEQFGSPDVQLFRASEIVHRHGVAVAAPDGIHLTAALHREVAEHLVELIVPWAQRQEHLWNHGPQTAESPPQAIEAS